ncbi:hypothetical protein [Pectinatus sottacetonis]|uniref:hypothetical protein n=1 Tax=Pectinatus sottacetonis TaxID=1002795 RepID=UPI0018C57D1E|nr:hypothetical protein [Pectinatus sottacetonis]
MRDRDNQRHNEIIAMESRLSDNMVNSTRQLFADIQNRDVKNIADLHGRDDQRHNEIIAIQKRMDYNIAGIKTEMKNTKRWIIGLVIATSLSFLGIAISLVIGMTNIVNIIWNLIKIAK